MIEPIQWHDGRLLFLDQTRLPHETALIETDDPSVVIGAIRELAIRGAPLIGIAGAYAAVLAAQRHLGRSWEFVRLQWDAIGSARPTAVNLMWAIDRMRKVVQLSGLVSRMDVTALEREATAIHQEDREACERIAAHGSALLPDQAAVLTHCNTGMLATGGIGTALGVIRKAWEAGRCTHVYVGETRPLLQGARLTAWELSSLQIPYTLITDSMAAVLMQRGIVRSVIVGADRIARNGDVANKVGSYGLAVLSQAHRLPFFVAAPVSTIDLSTAEGAQIPIEERSAREVVVCGGREVAPVESRVFNPAFDLVPARLVSAVITDRGIAQPPGVDTIAALTGTRKPA
ncbi:MAG: S-methyl-5-thioribose-1-phosphate isomerase [Bacteroidetes bacterium]|jgi:methylthioribose-1-phosphate isomerase|nr:S-methyl-5-thioribose-1-phosphate isomerase [Bacteroidota bacterium]